MAYFNNAFKKTFIMDSYIPTSGAPATASSGPSKRTTIFV